MPDAIKKSRNELKAAFSDNAVPTASDFASLIDAGLSQADDSVSRTMTGLEVSCLLAAKGGIDVNAARVAGSTHSLTGKPLYVTGNVTESVGSEFRGADGAKGIGIGLTTIYAAGTNQDLNLSGNGTGVVKATSALKAASTLDVTGTLTANSSLDVTGVLSAKSSIDIKASRSGTAHVVAGKPLYVTGNVTESLGSEFRSADGSKGIGIGLTTIYAAAPNQNLNLTTSGTGVIKATTALEAASTLKVSGVLTASARVDIATEPRTGIQAPSPATRPLYVTGPLTEEAGVEFRNTSTTMGLGFGTTTIYAVGLNQNLRLKPNGTGSVEILSKFKLGGGSVTKIATTMTSATTDDTTALPTQGAIRSFVNASIPIGAILMWSGAAVPSGWALCDGSNGTPNLRNRFILGSSATKAVGTTGGSETVTLTTAQLPGHSHSTTVSSDGGHYHSFAAYNANFRHEGSATESQLKDDSDGSFTVSTDTKGTHSHTVTVSNTGSGQAHDNMPPYYVLAFIMRIS